MVKVNTNSFNNSPANRGNKSSFNKGNNDPYNKANNRSSNWQIGEKNYNKQNFKEQKNFNKRGSNEGQGFNHKFTNKPRHGKKLKVNNDENAFIDKISTSPNKLKKFNDDDDEVKAEVINKRMGNDSKNDQKLETSSESEDEVQDQTFNKNNESEESEGEDTNESEDSKSEDEPSSNEVETSESDDDEPTSKNKMDEVETSESDEEDEISTKKTEVQAKNAEGNIKSVHVAAEVIVGGNKKLKISKHKENEVQNNEEPSCFTVFVCNIPVSVKARHLQLLFSKYGEMKVKMLKGQTKNKSSSLIEFINQKDAETSLEVNGMEYKGHRLFVRMMGKVKLDIENTVSVKCGFESNSNALYDAFQSFGVIQHIRKIPKSEYAHISFESTESVEILLKMGHITIGNQKLEISKVKKEDLQPIQPQNTNKKSTYPNKYHQRPAPAQNYHRRPAQGRQYHQEPRYNNYYEQPTQHRNYYQQPTGPNNYHQQPTQPRQYHQRSGGPTNYNQQPIQPRQYHQRSGGPNNYNQQPAQFNNYQGYSGPTRDFAPPAQPLQVAQPPKLEDVISPGLLVHKHKFDANKFTINFNGDKSQEQFTALKKQQHTVKTGFVEKRNKKSFQGNKGRK